MKIREIVERLDLKVRTVDTALEIEVIGGYASDLLSDVMANAQKGYLWVTLQTHQNIVAVATLKELAMIVIVNSRALDQDTVEKAEEEQIPIAITNLSAFEIIGRLYELGIKGSIDNA